MNTKHEPCPTGPGIQQWSGSLSEDSFWRKPAAERDAILQALDEERHARYTAGYPCTRTKNRS